MQYANSMPHRKHLLNNLLTHSSSPFCQPPPSSAFTARHTEMPHSFLLHRLSFTILTAVDSFTNLLLSCEAHIPPSPRTPRTPRPRSPRPIRRKNSILSTPSSPTSVKPHHSPTIPYPHPQKFPSIEEYPPPLRRSRTRHHLISSRITPRTVHDPPIHPRLTRREILPQSVRQQSHRHTQRQEKRTRTLSRHQSYNHYRQRFAFVDPPPNTSPSMQAVNPWHRNRDSVNRVAAHKRSRHVQPDPPVAPIALPSNPRPFPRGTLTAFLTTDDTGIFDFKQLETASSRDPLLEQGIRPSRRVRFAQKVQLVC